MAQRSEVAGSIGVILQQQRVQVGEPVEGIAGDRLIAATRRPDTARTIARDIRAARG